MTTKDFHVGDILSITTARLVSPSGMAGVSDILCFMTGETLPDIAFPPVRLICAPALLAQHPQLTELVDADADLTPANFRAWLDKQVAKFGETLPVAPLNAKRNE